MKNTKFTWKCQKCQKTTIEVYKYQFMIPKRYDAKVECSGCGTWHKLTFLMYCELDQSK